MIGVRPSGARRTTPDRLDADGMGLSALVAEPDGAPRAVVVALHGAGMSASYFHGAAHPDVSALDLGARLGFTVIALDRPGYGASRAHLPLGADRETQAAAVNKAMAGYAATHDTGAGISLLAHSFGGKVALTAAGEPDGVHYLSVDVSGCGSDYAAPLSGDGRRVGTPRQNWGALRCYPPGTFVGSQAGIDAVPQLEREDALHWPAAFPKVAAHVDVPVRLTFAEYESWWQCDDIAIARMADSFVAAPGVQVDRLAASGHNISLGWTARAYHLRAFAFVEECLAADAARAA